MTDNNKFSIRYFLARSLKQFRKDLNLSQLELANIAGLTHNYINDIEHEKKWPSAETISKLAEALQKEPYQLFMPERKWYLSEADFFREELSESITVMVKEKCDRYIMDNKKIPVYFLPQEEKKQ